MRECLFVLGMHRSGTSSVAGTFIALGGGAPTTIMPANSVNPKGYFESNAIVQLNDRILSSAGTTWHDWRAFNEGWYNSSTAKHFEEEAMELFASEFGNHSMPVLKDPRICRFLPFWISVTRRLEIEPKVIIPVRSPLEVAHSLKSRDGFPLSHGMLLWLRHTLDAERYSRGISRTFLSWNSLISDWRAVCRDVGTSINLSWPKFDDFTCAKIDEFLSLGLVHHKIDDEILFESSIAHEWTLDAYKLLRRGCVEQLSDDDTNYLSNLYSSLSKASSLFGPVLTESEIRLAEMAQSIDDLNKRVRYEEEQATSLEASNISLLQQHEVHQSDHDSVVAQLNKKVEMLEQTLEAERGSYENTLSEARMLEHALSEQLNVSESSRNVEREDYTKRLEEAEVSRRDLSDQLDATERHRNAEREDYTKRLEEAEISKRDLSDQLDATERHRNAERAGYTERLEEAEISNRKISERISVLENSLGHRLSRFLHFRRREAT